MDAEKFIVIPDLPLKSTLHSRTKQFYKKHSFRKQREVPAVDTQLCGSDEEMDMVDFLKHIPPKSISSGTSTRTPIGPPGDEEIDIYQFLHTSEPPQIPSSVVSSRMLASDTETESMSSCAVSEDEADEVDMFEFLRTTEPISSNNNNSNNNKHMNDNSSSSNSDNSDASTSEDEEHKEVSIYEFLQTTPPTSARHDSTNYASNNSNSHTEASTTKLSLLKRELFKILKDIKRRHLTTTAATSSSTSTRSNLSSASSVPSLTATPATPASLSSLQTAQIDNSISDIISILDFISLSSSPTSSSSSRLSGAPVSPRTRAEVDELELIDFLKTTSPTVPKKDVERMKYIRHEMGNIVKDIMTGKKQSKQKKEQKQKPRSQSQLSPRSPTSPRSPRSPRLSQPQVPRKPLKKEGSMRKLERFFGLIHGYDDDAVMDEAMERANLEDGNACGEMGGSSSDDCHDEQLEYEMLHSVIYDCEIHYDNLTFGRKIGEGAYAEVFIGTLRVPSSPSALLTAQQQQLLAQASQPTEIQVAIKLLKDAPSRQLLLNAFIREVTCLKRASGIGCVIQLKGCCVAPQCCIVLEYINGGSVADYLSACHNNSNRFSLRESVKCAKDIADAMAHLHSLHPPIIHRDLSPSNILLHIDNNGVVCGAVLSDFGIARGKDEKGLQLLSPVGHPRYRAPEVSKKQPYSKKVDVYCFGSCMYEMFSGRRLFSEMTDAEVCQMRQGGDVLICDDCGIPKSLRKLINRCWLLSPKHRPSFKEITHILDKQLKKLDRCA